MNTRPESAPRTALKAAAIAAAAGCVFAPVVRGTWLWDDPTAIAENPVLRDPGGLSKIWSGQTGQDFFPLTTSVQWIQWHLWHGEVAGYHLTNIVLHVLSALLLWRVLRQLGGRPGAAYAGGMLFAVHPLAVESVAWITELKNTLSLPFLLLAMIFWIRWSELSPTRSFDSAKVKAQPILPNGARSGQHAPPFYLMALLSFIAAMLSKSSVVMFPVILLLHAWWRRGRIRWADLRATAPFFAVSLALGLITIHFQATRAMAHLPVPAEGLATRIAAAGPAAVFYAGKTLLPVHLMPIYPLWSLDGSMPWRLMAWCAIVALLAWCWTKRASWGRHALFGLGFFFLNLIPVLGIVPMAFLRISRVSDHFAYLPLVGLIGLAAAGFGALFKFRILGPLVATALLAALAISSHRYARIFTSEESLWTYTLRRNPQAWLAHNNLGIVLAQSGRLDDAIVQGEDAVRLKPDFPEARSNLGLALTEAHRLPEAISQLEAAIQLNPDLAGAHLNLGRALLADGRGQEAVAQFEQVLRLRPGNPEARRNLAVAHNNLATALARAGRLPEAIAEFEKSLQLDPNNGGTHRNLGYALQAMGRDQEAAVQFEGGAPLRRPKPP